MIDNWLCGNCDHVGPLNKHGRCESCESIAVMPAVALRTDKEINAPKKKRKYTRRATEKDIRELERILSL